MRNIIAIIMGAIRLAAPLFSQEKNDLIINPKLKGGLGFLPFVGDTRPVLIDTMPPGWKPKAVTTIKYSDYIPQNAPPFALLITGKVPDRTKRYVVAITKDEAEFQRAFPMYKRLVAEKKFMEAEQALHICSNIAVATKVERFSTGGKVGDVPEKAGTFRFQFDLIALKDKGGCLTFLSYEPKPGDDVVDFGYGLDDTIHGVLMIEQLPTGEGAKPEYSMRVIKAKVTQ